MVQILPFTSAPSRRVTVTFTDDIPMTTFRTFWDRVSSLWIMDILDQDLNPLLTGVRILPRVDLIAAHPLVRMRFQNMSLSVADLQPGSYLLADGLRLDATSVAVHEPAPAPEPTHSELLV